METPGRSGYIPRPKSYDELRARPRFVEVLDKRAHALKAVLTDYRFPKMVRCGLSECRTPHFDGYLVETQDGHETNLGHVCGKRTFGESFELARAAFDRARATAKTCWRGPPRWSLRRLWRARSTATC